MPKSRWMLSPYEIAIAAVFTALVCVATFAFTIYVPHTEGFFNIGETMVYISALLFGPVVGGIAGGFGSMLADLILGYPHYAPATLVIKAFEGFIVGFLSRKTPKVRSKNRWKIYTALIGVFPGALLSIIGSVYYSGSVQLYLGLSQEQPTTILLIPVEAWYLLGLLISFFIILVGLISEPELGWTILSIILGGLTMVTGYFLYEQLFLGVLAYVEIPINIGQMTVGLVVSVPIVRAIHRYL
ncbi:MAG: ECF transporter S component, partial [Candidatus Bathyarchaeia archaeon]